MSEKDNAVEMVAKNKVLSAIDEKIENPMSGGFTKETGAAFDEGLMWARDMVSEMKTIKKRLIEIPVPVSPGRNVFVTGNFPMPRAEWDRLHLVLAAMAPALVIETDEL